MKDASHALNSGLVFSSSSRKCQVFKMIYCHAVRWGDRQLGNEPREECMLGSCGAPGYWWWPATGSWANPVAAPLSAQAPLMGAEMNVSAGTVQGVNGEDHSLDLGPG